MEAVRKSTSLILGLCIRSSLSKFPGISGRKLSSLNSPSLVSDTACVAGGGWGGSGGGGGGGGSWGLGGAGGGGSCGELIIGDISYLI